MSRNLNSEKCCYPRDVNIPSPVNFYKTIRILFLVACACLCIASPDLCQGILLFLLAFSNFSNMWNFQIWFSSIVSVVKIAISLTLPVSIFFYHFLSFTFYILDNYYPYSFQSVWFIWRYCRRWWNQSSECSEYLFCVEWSYHDSGRL